MTIHLITGMQGSGKTIYLVKKAYEYHKAGKKVYSNVALKFPYDELDYNDIVDCNLKNAVVILDEVHQLLPSRRSLSKINVSIVDGFLSMVRKQGLDIYGTTQLQRKVDVRFREEADYMYLMEKWAYMNGRWIMATESQDLSKDIPVMVAYMVYQSFTGQILKSHFYANHYYDLYDTRQVIRVRGIEV